MAKRQEALIGRLDRSAEAAYNLSDKLYHILHAMPSAVLEYGCFGSQTLYLATSLEQIRRLLPHVDSADKEALFKDLEKLFNLSDAIIDETKAALPSKPVEGADVLFLLPFDPMTLEAHVQALQVAATVIVTALQLGVANKGEEGTIADAIAPTQRFALSVINQLKKNIRDLKTTLPAVNYGRRPNHASRTKHHALIIEFLDSLLVTAKSLEKDDKKDEAADKDKEEDSSDEKEKEKEKPSDEENPFKVQHWHSNDPKLDGMPAHIQHDPNNVYTKVNIKDVETKSLDFYGLPYSKAKESPETHYVIWKPLEVWELDNLYSHTKKLRISQQHAELSAHDVIRYLLVKYFGSEAEGIIAATPAEPTEEIKELQGLIEELRVQDEQRFNRRGPRPVVYNRRARSYSSSPEREPVVRRRVVPYRGRRSETSKSEYWRSWGEQAQTLNLALQQSGWQPVYMRGTDNGQTWFYGPDAIHVRRFTDDYTPQDGLPKDKEGKSADIGKEYLIIGTEWIDEDALIRHGFKYQTLPTGHFTLDPRLTWGDLDLLVYASAGWREERLYRKYRNAENGDLHEARDLAVPPADYLHGSILEHAPRGRAPVSQQHRPGKLESMPEAMAYNAKSGAKKQEIPTPGVEREDSFVEVGSR